MRLEPIDKWEKVKNKCGKTSKGFTKNTSTNKKDLLSNLQQLRYELLHEEKSCEQFNKQNQICIQTITERIEELETEKIEATTFRSRLNWSKQGEKMTKYFFSLERRNFNNKTMFTILLPDGSTCSKQKRILKEQEQFYANLYTSDPNILFEIKNTYGVGISENQKTAVRTRYY